MLLTILGGLEIEPAAHEVGGKRDVACPVPQCHKVGTLDEIRAHLQSLIACDNNGNIVSRNSSVRKAAFFFLPPQNKIHTRYAASNNLRAADIVNWTPSLFPNDDQQINI